MVSGLALTECARLFGLGETAREYSGLTLGACMNLTAFDAAFFFTLPGQGVVIQ